MIPDPAAAHLSKEQKKAVRLVEWNRPKAKKDVEALLDARIADYEAAGGRVPDEKKAKAKDQIAKQKEVR
ncbi:MAG: hypothetical protein WC683_05010 [bacterium]